MRIVEIMSKGEEEKEENLKKKIGKIYKISVGIF